MSGGNKGIWELFQTPRHEELDAENDIVAVFYDYMLARIAQGGCRWEDDHNRYTVIGVG